MESHEIHLLGAIHKVGTHRGGGGHSQCVRLCISKWMTSQILRHGGGEGGTKILKNLRTYFMDGPL